MLPQCPTCDHEFKRLQAASALLQSALKQTVNLQDSPRSPRKILRDIRQLALETLAEVGA